MNTPESGAVVVVLDFRSEHERPADAARLQKTIAAKLREEGAGEPDDLRFLIVDTPAGLTGHADAYELVMGHPTLGSVSVVCLAVGDLPHSALEAQDARRLRLVSALRAGNVGVLWAADPQAGDETDGTGTGTTAGAGAGETGDRTAALRALVDLLRTPELFDRVFAALRGCPAATAAPAVRVLEHDLSPAVRDRAWDGALARFAGHDATPGAAGPAEPRPRDLPGRLGELAGGGPLPAAHRLLVPGGLADKAHRECEQTLLEAEQARSELARPGGLYTGRRVADRLPRAVEEAAQALRHYRELVAGALRDSGALGITPGQAALRLADAGIALPPSQEGRGARPAEEELGRFTVGLLDEGLDLHAAAGRLTALSEQLAPLPAGSRLAELDQRCPPGLARSVTAAGPFRFAAARPGTLATAAGTAFLGSLWAWPGTLLVLLPLGWLFAGHLMAAASRPNKAAGGPARLALPAQAAAAVLGAAGGWALGRVVAVPPWAALAGLLLSLLGTLVLLSVRWGRAVDDWWDGTGADGLAAGLEGVDSLLADALRQQWWAAEERTRCADGARALAGALRAAVTVPERPESGWDPGEGDWDGGGEDGWQTDDWQNDNWQAGNWQADAWPQEDTWPGSDGTRTEAPPPAYAQTVTATDDTPPPWLDRGSGDGGPDLMRTLVTDLADATVDALRRHWGAVDRATGRAAADGHSATPEQAVRQAIAAAHRHLNRNGIVPEPPFARGDRRRGDPMSLLGVGRQRLREALVPELTGRRLQPLCTPGQLALLSRDPAATRLIRFAPEAVRPVLADDGLADATDDAVWTGSGRFVGALSLTPLRAGVVKTVWMRGDQQDDDPQDDDPQGDDPRNYSGGTTW